MKMTIRSWVGIGALLAVIATVAINATSGLQAQEPVNKGLTEQSMGNMLNAMGLKVKKEEKRFDFNFKAVFKGEEWDLTMSTVLSQNGKTIWMMAWLDELPRSAADVPRTALLRLLAQNDRMGKGKSFAYIASNRRFVLQMVVPNQNISTAEFRKRLQELGGSVVETYPYWHVENWKSSSSKVAKQPKGSSSRTAKSPSSTTRKSSVRRATKSSGSSNN